MQWPAFLENDEPMEVSSSLCYAPLNKRLASFEDMDMLETFFVNSIISQSTAAVLSSPFYKSLTMTMELECKK